MMASYFFRRKLSRTCVLAVGIGRMLAGDRFITADKMKLYVSPVTGCDSTGDGSEDKPFGTLKQALIYSQKSGSEYNVYTKGEEDLEYKMISKSQMKKALKDMTRNAKKECSKPQTEQHESHTVNQDISYVTLKQDLSLPEAKKFHISSVYNHLGQRVKVYGWVNSIRRQGKNLMFIILRDGTGLLQCLLSNELCHTCDAAHLTAESTVCIYGIVNRVPEGKTAPGNVELVCDYWEVVSLAPAGGIETYINEESNPDTQLNYRHLFLRTQEMTKIMKVRSHVLYAFREHYRSRGYFEVSPPTMVQTQCEGGSTLFKFDYFGEEAFLTQSSQLYLETLLPSLGNVFCIAQSYRAESSKTRRHLAEYTHVEAEIPFIEFEDLLEAIEDLACDVLDRVLSSEAGEMIKSLNPDLKPLKKPFKRMLYTDALEYLREHKITKDDGTFYEFGDDIPEAPERKMTDQINEPILLIKFPAHIKAFYMQKDPKDPRLTESVDLLLPGVGEVIGGSMRMSDEHELLEAYKKEGVDPSPYYWYTDQRKFGTCEHGGYGLGFERYLTWVTNRFHIRDVCLYPRFIGRCTP